VLLNNFESRAGMLLKHALETLETLETALETLEILEILETCS